MIRIQQFFKVSNNRLVYISFEVYTNTEKKHNVSNIKLNTIK